MVPLQSRKLSCLEDSLAKLETGQPSWPLCQWRGTPRNRWSRSWTLLSNATVNSRFGGVLATVRSVGHGILQLL